MALEAVVFPQDPFIYGCKDYLYSLVGRGGGAAASGGAWSHDYGLQAAQDEKTHLEIINNNIEQSLHANWDSSSPPSVLQNVWDSHSSPEACCTVDQSLSGAFPPPSSAEATTVTTTAAATSTGRRKRRRTKSAKNKEEIENQRMTHIAVERNRRKQMNEYLAVLRSLMPSSYVQRGDQASIIGGAINFVKELEQFLQTMEGQKKTKQQPQENKNGFAGSPFAEFFLFPQYTTLATQSNTACTATSETTMARNQNQNQLAVADIEVTMVDSHANLKILSKKRPGQLMKMVVGLQSLRLSILHLNVTTVDDMVLTSVSVKIEDGCQLNTVDEIAAAVNQLLRRVQEEAAFS